MARRPTPFRNNRRIPPPGQAGVSAGTAFRPRVPDSRRARYRIPPRQAQRTRRVPVAALGRYRDRRRDRPRLEALYGRPVTGTQFEAEHPVGWFTAFGGQERGGLRRTAGLGRTYEQEGWAYQERRDFHRVHPGTTTPGRAQWYDEPATQGVQQTETGGDRYRRQQLALLSEAASGRSVASLGIQLTQLEYAHIRADAHGNRIDFGDQHDPDLRIADDSYETMVANMDNIVFRPSRSHHDRNVAIDARARAELVLARATARGVFRNNRGGFPDETQENAVRQRFGLTQIGANSPKIRP